MANYYLVADSRYKPFTYQELLAPVLAAEEAHRELENAYSELDANSSLWDNMIDRTTDDNLYDIYKNYRDELQQGAEQLAKEGLNPSSRSSLLKLKAKYNQVIKPLEIAYAKREADIAAQKEAKLKDPSKIFDRYASEVSLNEYVNNKNLDVISTNLSKDALTAKVATAAANLKEVLQEPGQLEKLGLPFQYQRRLAKGESPESVLLAISKDPKASPILTKLVDNVMEESGMRKWSSMNGDWVNNEIYKEAEAAAYRGLFNAIGKADLQAFKDDAGFQLYKYNLEKEDKASVEKTAQKQAQEQILGQIKPASIFSKEEKNNRSDEENQLKQWRTKGYLKKTHSGYIITPEGWKEANSRHTRGLSITNPYGPSIPSTVDTKTKFGRFLDKLGVVSDSDLPKLQDYITSLETGYDANRATEFVYDYETPAEQSRIKNMISRAVGNSDIQVVSYKDPEQGYTSDGTIDVATFNSKYQVLARKASVYGQVYSVLDENDEYKEIRVPEVHRAKEESVKRSHKITQQRYQEMKALEPEVSVIHSLLVQGLSYSDLSSQQRQLLQQYIDLEEAYKDALWQAEIANREISNGYN